MPPAHLPYPAAPPNGTPFEPRYTEAVEVAPNVLRITAANASHFTFMGTNSYLVAGCDNQAVLIDPGPALESHTTALLSAIGERKLAGMLITHSHMDHTSGLSCLRKHLSAPTFGEGPHRLARALAGGETNAMKDAGDWDFQPDQIIADGERFQLAGLRFEGIATPGHAANHLAFALEGTGIVFIGDQVMAHTSTIVAPPEGSMADYLASLERLRRRDDVLYLSGHGGEIHHPKSRIDALLHHRSQREASLRKALTSKPQSIEALVSGIYTDIAPAMLPAAKLSLQAQLEYLVDRGEVTMTGAIPASALYRLS